MKTLNFVLALSLFAFTGCANKNNVADNEQADGFTETTEEVADNAAQPAAEGSDPAEAELFGEAQAEAATGTEAPTGASNEDLFAATDSNAEPNFEELAGTTPTDSAALAVPTEPSTLDPASQGDPLAATSVSPEPAPMADAQAFSDESSFAATPKPRTSVASAPKIPGRALTRGGKTLNRYYFLRQGDTAKSVSNLIYGNPGQTANLKKANKGSWTPGKVVYYTSALQADDAQMVSFYEEHNLTAENYTVRKGETMSSIAKAKLGHRMSWKEIAVTNGLTSPNNLDRGQQIRIYTDLRPAAPPVEMAQAPVQETIPQAAPEAFTPPAAIAAAPAIDAPPAAQEPVVNDLNEVKKKPAKQPLNAAKLLSQNAFSIAMGLGIGLLLVSLLMINKRKKGGNESAADEFGEDAFAAPSKKKRQ